MNFRQRIEWLLRMVLLVFILASAAFLSAITAMRIAIHGREVSMPNLVGKNFHVIGCCHDRPFPVLEACLDMRHSWSILWMEHIPAAYVQCIPPYFIEAGNAPYFGRDKPIFRKEL